MYGLPGQVYIYFTYGIHWLLNFVTEEEGYPAAVLIRGINPTEGLNTIAKRREGRPRAQWTDGPAKICQGFNLDGTFNGADICDPKAILFVEEDEQVLPSNITISPRVGLNNVPEPWKSIPWNFKMNF